MMNKYVFKAKDLNNKVISGRMEASSKNELKEELINNRLYPILISRDYEILNQKKIPDKILLSFIQQWYALEKSNVKTQDALKVIKSNETNKKLSSILNIICIKLDEGLDVITCFAKNKAYFPEIFIEMLNIGFQKSNMAECLFLLKEYYEEKCKNQNKIKNAFVYPKLLLIALFIALLVVSKFIVPSFKNLYSELNTTLSGFTKFIFSLLTFIGDHIFLMIILIIFFIILFLFFKRTRIHNIILDKLKLSIPIIKNMEKTQNIYLFLKSINILWKNNYNKIKSIDIIQRLLPNVYFQKAFINVKSDVESGLYFGESLRKSKLFDENVCQILTIGEQMNILEENIESACVWYSFDLQNKTDKFIKMIEPMMISIMALFILLIILVIFIPMLSSIRMVI